MLHLPISELIHATDENNETICDKSDCNYVSATDTFPGNMTATAEGDVTQNSSLDYKEFYEVAQFITGLNPLPHLLRVWTSRKYTEHSGPQREENAVHEFISHSAVHIGWCKTDQ